MEERQSGMEYLVMNDHWEGRRVLVTGGSGFIGYALARELMHRGAKVTILDIKALPSYATKGERKKIKYIRGSVTSNSLVKNVLKRGKVDTVFHLAAEAIVQRAQEDPSNAFDTNVRGTWVILETVRQYFPDVEVVVASSDKAYGSHPKLPYKEDAPLMGVNPYDASKSAADIIANSYAKTFGLSLAIARCGNVYGPGDLNWTRLIPGAFASLASDRILDIRSDGTFRRDYLYIDDIIDGYLAVAKNMRMPKVRGEAFNFGNNHPQTVRDILGHIQKVAPSLRYRILNVARNEIRDQFLDSTKAMRVVKWRARTSIASGIEKTAAWYSTLLSR